MTAACAIANIVKSSLGPIGLDKMLVDNIGVSEFYCLKAYNIFFWNYLFIEINYLFINLCLKKVLVCKWTFKH